MAFPASPRSVAITALAFGRAGRISSIDIRSYGVFAAAREHRAD